MSIFSEASIKEINDSMIEKYYILIWDFMRGKKIKQGLFPRRGDDKEIYYNPGWLFYFYLSAAVTYARYDAKGFRGEFKLSDLDESNLRYKFKNMIKDCDVLKYKSSNYVLTDPYDNTVDCLKSQIVDMMYNYITKETNKSKYFKK